MRVCLGLLGRSFPESHVHILWSFTACFRLERTCRTKLTSVRGNTGAGVAKKCSLTPRIFRESVCPSSVRGNTGAGVAKKCSLTPRIFRESVCPSSAVGVGVDACVCVCPEVRPLGCHFHAFRLGPLNSVTPVRHVLKCGCLGFKSFEAALKEDSALATT